jgi:formate/nitrite transporter FocA (FNT family)
VSLGNIIAGALFVAGGYALANGKAAEAARGAPVAVAAE